MYETNAQTLALSWAQMTQDMTPLDILTILVVGFVATTAFFLILISGTIVVDMFLGKISKPPLEPCPAAEDELCYCKLVNPFGVYDQSTDTYL